MSTKDAYQRGYDAGRQGFSYFACPYSPSHHRFDYDKWMRGHADGMRDVSIHEEPEYGLGYMQGRGAA
ncbi:Rmf/CrpP family protein [Pararobbsia alpina]|uniref:Ribosome modulation factor n=1 Tax=Pararobbsia alpina TaxID=621374 RepID=A0A6S7C9W8_9BURK|nr:Rmf/CrpP family protein [Pararobbsia alpina]CAB3784608.1 hypothetical protein LMG28138_01843 [Pararobbsia alpina]